MFSRKPSQGCVDFCTQMMEAGGVYGPCLHHERSAYVMRTVLDGNDVAWTAWYTAIRNGRFLNRRANYSPHAPAVNDWALLVRKGLIKVPESWKIGEFSLFYQKSGYPHHVKLVYDRNRLDGPGVQALLDHESKARQARVLAGEPEVPPWGPHHPERLAAVKKKPRAPKARVDTSPPPMPLAVSKPVADDSIQKLLLPHCEALLRIMRERHIKIIYIEDDGTVEAHREVLVTEDVTMQLGGAQ